MTVGTTTTFNLTIAEIIDEAADMAGGMPITSKEYTSAMRLLDLILTDWSNRGILLFALEQIAVTLAASTTAYTLSTDAKEVMTAVIQVSGRDFPITRISHQEYLDINLKNQTGRPTQFFIDKQASAPIVNVWPLPTSTTHIFKYWKIRLTKDSNSLRNNPDIHRRYLPALVSGLAYYLALRRPTVTQETRSRLRFEYEAMLDRAMLDDSDKATFTVKPEFSL